MNGGLGVVPFMSPHFVEVKEPINNKKFQNSMMRSSSCRGICNSSLVKRFRTSKIRFPEFVQRRNETQESGIMGFFKMIGSMIGIPRITSRLRPVRI